MNKIRRFLIDEDESEVYAISLVDSPAIESDFVYLSKEKPKFINLESEEKHIIYGPALRPNFPIYRNDGENEYYIEFSRKCVENLAQKFLKQNYQFNFTTDHKEDAHGITVVESWIKADLRNDKSLVLGLDDNLPVGSWIIGCKVENEEIWKQVKEGTFLGFSVEAFCNLNEIKFKKEIMNNINLEEIEVNDSFWSKLKSILNEALGNGETVEDAVEEVKEEVVEDEPKEEKEEEMVEETPTLEEEVVEEIPTEEMVEEIVETVEEALPDYQAQIDELQAIIDGLNGELESKNAEIDELKKENQKLSKQPSAETINVQASKQNETPSWLDFACGNIKLK